MNSGRSEASADAADLRDDVVKPYYGTRTLLELSVGCGGSSSHRRRDHNRRGGTSPVRSVEVIVYLRRADLAWWNSDVSYHQRQLFRLMGRNVLPNVKECSDAIMAGRRHNRGGGNGGVVIGEKNRPVDSSAATAKKGAKGSKKAPPGGGKRKVAGKKRGRPAVVEEKQAGTKEADAKKKKKGLEGGDVTFLFGETIQIAYRTEDVNTSESATLLFDPDDPAGVDEEADGRKAKRSKVGKEQGQKFVTFTQARKLPKRIVLWAYRFDPENPTDPVPEDGGGFPRPEMVPISSLFRQPA